MWLGIRLIGLTPDQYANFPVYVSRDFPLIVLHYLSMLLASSQILASPDAERTLGSGKYFDRQLNPTQLGKWSKDPKNRVMLWGKLKEIIGEK
jgi:hypothetical protein